ncbi:MAG: hypothetical protein WCF67_23495 [Chitinophagaceae bacterium]
MNKIFLLIALVCTFHEAVAQERYTDTAYYGNDEIRKAGLLNTKDSTWTVYHYYNSDYGNKKIHTIEFLAKDGFTKIGEEKGFHHNGQLAYSIIWKAGLAQGAFTEYFPDGKIKVRGNFYNHFKSGTWREYDSLGTNISGTDFRLSKADSNYAWSYTRPPSDKIKFTILKIRFGEMPNPHFAAYPYYVQHEFPVALPAKQVKLKTRINESTY